MCAPSLWLVEAGCVNTSDWLRILRSMVPIVRAFLLEHQSNLAHFNWPMGRLKPPRLPCLFGMPFSHDDLKVDVRPLSCRLPMLLVMASWLPSQFCSTDICKYSWLGYFRL